MNSDLSYRITFDALWDAAVSAWNQADTALRASLTGEDEAFGRGWDRAANLYTHSAAMSADISLDIVTRYTQ